MKINPSPSFGTVQQAAAGSGQAFSGKRREGPAKGGQPTLPGYRHFPAGRSQLIRFGMKEEMTFAFPITHFLNEARDWNTPFMTMATLLEDVDKLYLKASKDQLSGRDLYQYHFMQAFWAKLQRDFSLRPRELPAVVKFLRNAHVGEDTAPKFKDYLGRFSREHDEIPMLDNVIAYAQYKQDLHPEVLNHVSEFLEGLYATPLKGGRSAKSALKEVILSSRMSEEAREKVREMTPKEGSDSDEDKKRRDYVRYVKSLPWGAYTQDTNDVEVARQMMDQNFYGLNQLKDRILQKIAMRRLRGDTGGAIFLLVGPGGTGKTGVAEVIAAATGRKYARVSLAGENDSHNINGHRYTYVGSKAGKVVDAFRKAGSMNPVIQLDEVDKTGSGSNGNVKDALLAVLDPDNNHQFEDAYLDIPFDLSNGIFILTANSLDGFPEHFLSRVEVIEFPAYLESEKMAIARQHLIPKKIKELNLSEGSVEISDAALEETIRRFTREGGVRKLNARIQELLERAGINIIYGAKKVDISPLEVSQWLSNPRPAVKKIAANQNEIGESSGLYYSLLGGGRLPIQVDYMPGSGRLILTGSLKDVMKESAQVVLSYIRKNAKELGVPEETAQQLAENKLDVHIHYPDTATPKDGPSAGISTFLAAWSAFTGKKIPQNLGLTGEIDLRGNILPIGGVKEKISGAFYEGVTRFILPESNQDEYEDAMRKSAAFAEICGQVDVRFLPNVKEVIRYLEKSVVNEKASSGGRSAEAESIRMKAG